MSSPKTKNLIITKGQVVLRKEVVGINSQRLQLFESALKLGIAAKNIIQHLFFFRYMSICAFVITGEVPFVRSLS